MESDPPRNMLIDLAPHLRQPWQRRLYQLAAPVVDRSLALRSFNRVYADVRPRFASHPQAPSAFAFFDCAMIALDAQVLAINATGGTPFIGTDKLSRFPGLPATGPLVVVCNHPFGLFDPVALGSWVTGQRPDVKIMANHLLQSIPELAPWLIAVDPFNGKSSRQRNLGPMRDALRHLRTGGTLMVFPAGEVAHYRPGRGITEGPWSPHVGALIRRAKATVVTAHVDGRNGVLFHAAGLVHPKLRTGLLLHELKRHRHQTVRITIGPALPPSRLSRYEDDTALTKFLRLNTLMLGRRSRRRPASPYPSLPGFPFHAANVPSPLTDTQGSPAIPSAWRFPLPRRKTKLEAIVAQTDPDAILADIKKLRHTPSALLLNQGKFSVFCAIAGQIPAVLREIGRQREITFREVGEGSGRSLDIDGFDANYLHLFLWDEHQQCLAGAYRMVQADLLVRRHGPGALYTSSLFHFEPAFLDQLDGALELGRSFIRPEYQRELGALALLWRGIGRWIAAHPGYRQLFGPVSISREYDGLSRRLMVEFLRTHRWHTELAPQVRPRRPFRGPGQRRWLREFTHAGLHDIEEFSNLIASIESDGKGLPVLLKHYLKLEGTLLAFNVDRDFGSVLDGLILVELPSCDPRVLSRYLGQEACRAYLAHHHRQVQPA